MRFYGDYHVHSYYSDGEQNVEDIVQAARAKGLQEVAITDHGPLVAGIGIGNTRDYLKLRTEIDACNQVYDDIHVLLGAEANIRDSNGTLDIPDAVIEELDILLAGLHPYTWPASWQDGWEIFCRNSLRHLGRRYRVKAINANTKALVETIYVNSDKLDIISHPGLFFEVEVKEVARACAEKEVLFEINCGHHYPVVSDIIEAGKQGTGFIINSDSHFTDSVGELDYGGKIISEWGLSEQVINVHERGGHINWCKKKNCEYS